MLETPYSEEGYLRSLLTDRNWRLSNLYWITGKEGQRVKFSPNWAQEELLRDLHYRNVILKARQIGFTTFIQLLMLDECLFNSNISCGTIAHSLPDAQSIFKHKIKFPYDNLPVGIKQAVHKVGDSASELHLANNSSIRVGTSLRSGTFQFLHISELGKIAATRPDKAQEIRTGALNTVSKNGYIFIESTAEGPDGDFHSICSDAMSIKRLGSLLTKLDYRFHFFPWHRDPEYSIDPTGVVIPDEFRRYFDTLEETKGIKLTDGQKAWYVKTALTQREDVKREFPATPEEAFEASIEGSYYGPLIDQAELQGRIGEFKALPEYPVHTAFDLGFNDYTSIWFWQNLPYGRFSEASLLNATQIRLVGFYQNSGEAMPHYVSEVEKLYKLNGWSRTDAIDYFPHDAKVHDLVTGKTRLEQFVQLGFRPRLVPMMKFDDGINAVRITLPHCHFDQTACSEGIGVLKAYRKRWNEEKGIWSDQPLHNWASHGSDAFRYLCAAQKDLAPIAEPPKQNICSLGTYADLRNEALKKGKQHRRFARR